MSREPTEERMRLIYGPHDGEVHHFASLVLEGDAGALAYAYFDATEQLLAAGRARELLPNLAAFPVLFLFRLSVELQLKAVLTFARSLGDDVVEPTRTHELADLWGAVRAYLLERWPGEESALPGLTLREIDENIALLEKVDPQSTTFRYADAPLAFEEDLRPARGMYGIDLARAQIVVRGMRLSLEAIVDARAADRDAEDAAL